jgi:hypothetical protein
MPNLNPSIGSGSGVEEGDGEGGGDGDAASSIQCLRLPARLPSLCHPRCPRYPQVGGGDELWAPPPRLPPRLPQRLPPRHRSGGRPSRPPFDPMPSAMVSLMPPYGGVDNNSGEEGRRQRRCARLARCGRFKKILMTLDAGTQAQVTALK